MLTTQKYVNQKVVELNGRLRAATRHLKDNSKGTDLYKIQVEYSYLVDESQRGPEYIARKHLQDAELMIEKLEQQKGEKAG